MSVLTSLLGNDTFWVIVAMIAGMALPNKRVYLISHSVGFMLRGITLRFLTERHTVAAKAVGWIFDTFGTFLEGVVDGWKGVNKYSEASIEKARERAKKINGQ